MSKSGNRKSRSNEGFILYQNNVGKTVQTSWRPQLPLPKEVVPPTTSADTRSSEMNRHNNAANQNSSSNKKDTYHQSAPQISSGGNKKWSFGRLFRKKKEAETESSSEEDRKAGFVTSPKYRKKDKKKRGSKLISGGFDHIVVTPTRDNEFFLPFEPVASQESMTQLSPTVEYEPHSRSTHSLDRRSRRDRKKLALQDPAQPRHPSSEEEMISLNSSTTFAKYRSDESLGSGGNGNSGQSRRSRAARNERYYKRLSRDGEVSHGQAPVMYAPQPAQRWKTQPVPLSIYGGQTGQNPPPPVQKRPQYPAPTMQDQKMRNSTSLSHVAPHVPVTYGMLQPPKNLQNTVNDGKRSISYDSHIHLQNVKKPLPPPPPPRDPLRRVNVAGHNDHRPISYAFDQSSSHAPTYTGMSGRCVSDDRIWAGNAPMYQSASSINYPPPSTASAQHRRFITRAERDAHPAKKSLPSGLDFRYVAEAAPRSRKPIHLFNQGEDQQAKPPSPIVIRTTKSGLPVPAPAPGPVPSNAQLSSEYWRRGRDQNLRPDSILNKPRSVSSSRVGEMRNNNTPMYSEVSKPKAKPKAATVDEVDSVVSGSLLIKPSKDNQTNYIEIRNNANKSHSMPNHYQRRDLQIVRGPKADSPTPNKYEEYVAEKRVRNTFEQPKVAPDPPQRKVITKPLTLPPEPDVILRKKPTNLEDAINELEAIYKSLKLGDEDLLERAERRDVPPQTNFEKYAELHTAEYDDDEESPAGEPDVVRDDFAYRNIKLANLPIKSSEKQPPFGIPINPIPASPRTDYLHVTPDKEGQKVRTAPFKYPDIVSDDLAVRTLRKDPPGLVKTQFAFPVGSLKKKRATRTQSANIYSLIQRNAAKPSGGDLQDYLELAKSLERAGSMSDIRKETDDIPSTLQLIRNLREQEQGSPKVIPFRHPSQGGAICSLPKVLTKADEQHNTKAPVPLPRKSLSPDPEKTKMEDALNKIAKEAKESSEKLTRELMELRKEALITSSRPKVNKPSIERDLEQIEAVSEAAKRCRHILMDTIPPEIEDPNSKLSPPRRLVTEDKLIKAIDQVSDAANKVCEKILNEIVTVEPPVIVQNAIEVKNRPKQELVMPSLIQKLDPSSARIGEIAERCMRQISQLNDIPDYDNLQPVQVTACNTTKNDTDRAKRSDADLLIVPGAEEEIDKIMKECEEQARNDVCAISKDPLNHSDDAIVATTAKTTATTTSASSSSDCLKSSSPSAGPHLSSSITSFNPYSSSDYIKSPSSEFHAPSTDPIKTFSTTSYDVMSSSVTPNITNSSFSYTPSPPLNLTPVCSSGGEKGERSGSASQYNSSEELAMIFGIEKSSPATTTTGKDDDDEEGDVVVVDCPVPSPAGVLRCSEPNKPDVLPISIATTNITTSATNPDFCESVIVCKLATIDEDREDPSSCQVSRLYVPSYASNVSIIVTGADSPTDHEESGQQFDSLSTIDDSSNPDSGNVSLSDFPVPSPINASLEMELAHNSRYEIAKKFVNEITIDGESTSDVDYLRSLFAQDELSTSFSFDETVTEIQSDQDDDGHYQIDAKDQYSPGHLLHEVLSQVSRINAGTNRRQLISQLENISECTKIVENLSDRLSHQASRLRSREEEGRNRGTYRVRFSEECDNDHEDDHNECLKSLQKLGHHLSSSEESIPPLGEIFNVPMTDSEFDDEESDESPYVGSFNFDERQRSIREDCNSIKEALHRVVQSGLIDGDSKDDSLTLSSEVVSIVETRVDDPQLEMLLPENGPLTVSSIVEVVDSGPKSFSDDEQLRSLSKPLRLISSEVVSIVEVLDGDCVDHLEVPEYTSDHLVDAQSSNDGLGLPEWDSSNSSIQIEDFGVDPLKWSLNSDSYGVPSQLSDLIVIDSDDEKSQAKSYEAPSRISEVIMVDSHEKASQPMSYKAPSQVSEVIMVDSDEKASQTMSFEASSQNSEVIMVVSDAQTSQAMSFESPSQNSEVIVVDSDDEISQTKSYADPRQIFEMIKVDEASPDKSYPAPSSFSGVIPIDSDETSQTKLYEAPSQYSQVIVVDSDNDELPSNDLKTGSSIHLSPLNISLKIVNQVSKVSIVECSDAESFGPVSPVWKQNQASEMIEVDSDDESYSNFEAFIDQGKQSTNSLEKCPLLLDQASKIVSVDSDVFSTSRCSESYFLTSEASESEFEVLSRDLKNAHPVCQTKDNDTFGSQESLEIIYEEPLSQEYNEQPLESLQLNCQTNLKHQPSLSEGSIQYQNPHQQEEPVSEDAFSMQRYRPSSSPADIASSSTSKTLSILAQPRPDDRMTTLEHVLLACTFGVVTGNDLITMLAIIIGVLTLIAIILL